MAVFRSSALSTSIRKSVLAIAAVAAAAAMPAQAEYNFGFANVYGDYLTWEQGSKDLKKKGGRDSHYTIGAEAGANFSWGEVYGFYEYEKVGESSKDRSQAMKVAAHYKLVGDFTLYGQVYDLNDNRFSDEQNRVIGFGYTGLTGNGWWFKPFAGYHDISVNGNDNDDEINGGNGGMIGWNAGAMFNVAGIPMMVTNWHETEFNRNEGYASQQGGKNGHNGAVGLWVDITEKLYTGVQYRYFRNKLGWEGYGDAVIYRIGYHL